MNILVTGGAGFIGFNLLSYLNDLYPNYRLIAIDNLKRLGSETNITALAKRGIKFIHGDIRNTQEINMAGAVDIIIHCASDASILSGITSSSELVIQNNLLGSINIFEYAVQQNARLIFFSTNRVYGSKSLNEINYSEENTRFKLNQLQTIHGVSEYGISEEFPLLQSKTFYGATKYCSEILLMEYAEFYGLKYVINRFGIVSGKGQFGTRDQGIISYWLKQHYFKEHLCYFGYGGHGKQVRDAIHIMDLCRIIDLQINNISTIDREIFNIGGGKANSFSLQELTQYCQDITGNKLVIENSKEIRPGDIPLYYTDNRKISEKFDWLPKQNLHEILSDLFYWYKEDEKQLS